MTSAPRSTRRLLTFAAGGGLAVATLLGLLTPSPAQAAISVQTNRNAGFHCAFNCAAGGVGRVPNGRYLLPPTIGQWPRTFLADCKFNASNGQRMLRGRVADRNWSGSWNVSPSDIRSVNDRVLPWC